MATAVMAHRSAQMKTDAYTECRGVGRIACNDRPTAGRGQAKRVAARAGAQEENTC